MVVEQKVAEQVALVSRAEHNLNEEYAVLCRNKQDSDTLLRREVEEMGQERGKLRVELLAATKDTGVTRSEIEEMSQEHSRFRVEFMHVTKDAGALNQQLLEQDDEVRQLRTRPTIPKSTS